ncbi:unnamed protein product [Musa textilis]
MRGKKGCGSEQSVCINTSSLQLMLIMINIVGHISSTTSRRVMLTWCLIMALLNRLDISESDPFYGDKLDIAESNDLDETAYFDIALGCLLPPLMLPYLLLVALGGTDAFLSESVFRIQFGVIWNCR